MIVVSYARRSLLIRLAVRGTMAAKTCKYLNFLVDQATTTTIRQPPTKVTIPRFVAPDGEITIFTPTGSESISSLPTKPELGPASRKYDSQVGSLVSKSTPPQDWQSMLNLFLLEEKALKGRIL